MAAVKKLNPKAEVARAAQALDLNISGKGRRTNQSLLYYSFVPLFSVF